MAKAVKSASAGRRLRAKNTVSGTGQTAGAYRLWTRTAAPESAKESALLVLGENGARGNAGAFGAGTLLMAAGIIATIIISAVTLDQVNQIPKSN